MRAAMQMYTNHFGVWWPISCGPLNNNNVLTEGKGLDVRSVWPSPGPLHGHDLFLKKSKQGQIKTFDWDVTSQANLQCISTEIYGKANEG